jgi:hypothetical protein
MSFEHVSPILTATVALWVARLLCRRYLRTLIRTTLAAVLGAAGLLVAASGHSVTIGSLLAALRLSVH